MNVCDHSASKVFGVLFNTPKVLTSDSVRSQWAAVSSHLELGYENKNIFCIALQVLKSHRKFVGWVERSETQHLHGFVGFRSSTQPTPK
ncbi:MAG: hypothetical protein V7K14_07135 [Nostoc sp.]|uniref:hypothetical protein n=1 Tax=Nostoc sp. TaxID=1180 RepID=UPI002FF9ACD6